MSGDGRFQFLEHLSDLIDDGLIGEPPNKSAESFPIASKILLLAYPIVRGST